MGERGFFGRIGLIAPAIAAPVAEVAFLRALSPQNAALAPQVTAPPPLDLFHDLRWVSVFHNSWLTLALELTVVVVLRSLWVAWMVQRAWPREGAPGMPAAARRVSLFYAVAIVLFAPWVVLLFGLAFTHLSFLFFSGVPPALMIAAVIHRGAATRAAGLRLGWRPTWRSLAWLLSAFLWLTAAGGLAESAPLPVALFAAAVAGLLNARAFFGIVQDLATGRARRPLPALTPVLVVVVFAMTVGGAAFGFAVAMGHGSDRVAMGPVPTAAPGQHPVLIAAGLHSHYDPTSPLRLPQGYVGWRYSYRGLDPRGRPLPYGPSDTQQSLLVSARRMAEEVDTLHRAYGEPVTVVAESEGALVARTFLVDVYDRDSRAVDRLITLDMVSGVSAVYFPPRGKQGWGVASGWGLRGLTEVLGSISSLRLSVDSDLGREVTDCRAFLARLASAPAPPGVQEVSFQALADWVDPPASGQSDIPTFLVTAAHGGLVNRVGVQSLIQGVLSGDPAVSSSEGTGLLARLVRASARPWEAPTLPYTLDPQDGCKEGSERS